MATWEEFAKTIRAEEDVHVFAREGRMEDLKTVLTPTSVDLQDPRGYTPLILACYHGHRDTAEFLLAQGADPNIRDIMGNTALMGAAFKGHLDCVSLLLDHGADTEAANPQGLTAKGFAKLFGRDEVAKRL